MAGKWRGGEQQDETRFCVRDSVDYPIDYLISVANKWLLNQTDLLVIEDPHSGVLVRSGDAEGVHRTGSGIRVFRLIWRTPLAYCSASFYVTMCRFATRTASHSPNTRRIATWRCS